MEEIKGTEALEREILDDASKKADKIVRKAKDDAEKLKQNSAGALEKKIAELESQKLGKSSRMEKEIMSKLPLEKTRLRARFLDDSLQASMRQFLDSLDETELGAWCLAELKKRSSLLAGKRLGIRYKGIDSASLREIEALIGSNGAATAVPDLGASSRGLVIASLDGAMTMTLTESELERRLLDEYRGELASALFPAAAGEDERR